MSIDFSHVTFISAGAGSGKTYRLTQELERAIVEEGVDPARVIGTTFTRKAAAELKERVHGRLIEGGRLQVAEEMAQALIGTVHSVCERLLKRFAFELGLSPELNVMSSEDGNSFFNQALDDVLSLERVRQMNELAYRLGQEDWQLATKKLAEKVRENDIAVMDLATMAAQSADALLAFFPKPARANHSDTLKRAIQNALEIIDTSTDTTKKTSSYLAILRQAILQLNRDDCPWDVWIRLSAEESAKKSDNCAASVREAALVYEQHPDFHADVRAYIEGAMEIAGRTLERFQALKTERGLIDYLDMEHLVLRALDEQPICARLECELDLLLVDEFQDTNPMQLALFMKLAMLAKKVVFVGDVKQAVYAFRGCDPDLVFQTLEGIAGGNAKTDNLPHSWRSRPALVSYVNETFAAAFATDKIDRELVVLSAQREERTEEPAVLSWKIEGKNKDLRAEALAQGVTELVQSGYQIVDPEHGSVRPVRWGDIAILARTNNNVELIARTLKNRCVPMKMTLSGLLETPEVCLARACLRRLNDSSDTLATAEILSMAECAEPETWLTDRLAWLDQGEASYAWAEDSHPIIARLKTLRADSALRSPLEMVARTINDVGIRFIATRWGPDAVKAAQRQRNLDAFLELAVDYENHCDLQHQAATLTGFLFWLEKPSDPEIDRQPMVTSGDAVQVLTYHRGKGLEWPVVIAADFDVPDRSTVWDTRVGLTANFVVTQPLANRNIRFWPNVFGRRSKNIPALDRIQSSDEGRVCEEKSASEQRRLAYVGLTRARDLVVIALPPKLKENAWLSTFASDSLVPTAESLNLPNGEQLLTGVRSLDGSGALADPEAFQPHWFVQRERRDDFLKETLSPSYAQPIEGVTIGEVIELGERIPLNGGDMTAIGSALHAVIAADIVNPDQDDARERANGILEAYGVDTFISPEDCIEVAQRLRAALAEKFPGAHFRVELPFSHALEDGRVVKGFIDLLVETSSSLVIVDHKSSPRPRSEWPKEALEHSGQLYVYQAAVSKATGSVTLVALHFPVSGGLMAIEK